MLMEMMNDTQQEEGTSFTLFERLQVHGRVKLDTSGDAADAAREAAGDCITCN